MLGPSGRFVLIITWHVYSCWYWMVLVLVLVLLLVLLFASHQDQCPPLVDIFCGRSALMIPRRGGIMHHGMWILTCSKEYVYCCCTPSTFPESMYPSNGYVCASATAAGNSELAHAP